MAFVAFMLECAIFSIGLVEKVDFVIMDVTGSLLVLVVPFIVFSFVNLVEVVFAEMLAFGLPDMALVEKASFNLMKSTLF